MLRDAGHLYSRKNATGVGSGVQKRAKFTSAAPAGVKIGVDEFRE